ncbi:hypothetical protein T5B8_09746 [Salinisphaera sp. T5B8]|uniref:DUF6691 family protein n=1 Tax=Salinisphaera sp. T5B8 TaxID=1304154 RepID=UPI00333EE3B5
MRHVITLASGVLFGVGLTLSGMVDPTKVLAFLDPLGPWDPTLAVVMASALSVFAAAHAIARTRARPLCAERFHEPARLGIDRPLLIGAALFGIGWGMAGYCPGPGLAALVYNAHEAVVFLPAVLLGCWLAGRYRA